MKVQFSPQSKFSGRSTLLLVGSGVLADTLAKHLATPEVEVVRTARDRMFEVVAPGAAHCMVLVGDAASERGSPLIRETLQRLGAEAPLIVVVSAPQIGGLSPQPMPAGAALLTPEGGMVECARRLRALLEQIHGGGLEQSSLQNLVDQTSRKATNASATQKIGASLAPVVARVETQPNLGASAGAARVEAPRQPAANAAAARPRQPTLLGSTPSGIAPVARPQSTRIDVRASEAPAAIGGSKPSAVPSIAAAVSNALGANQPPPVEMMWGEATPTVVARTRSRQQSGNLELQPGEVELVIGDAPDGSEADAAGALGSADVPSPSRAPEMPAPVSASSVKAKPRQPTLHGQAPLSLSALASAGGSAVGVEVRIRTSSTSAMKKVTAPEPSGSLPPTAAVPSQAAPAEAEEPELEVSESLEGLHPPQRSPVAGAPAPRQLSGMEHLRATAAARQSQRREHAVQSPQRPAASERSTEASSRSSTSMRSAAPDQSPDSLSPVVMRTEASVEVSLASLEPPAVSFSESAPDFAENPEAPTPIAISIPVRTDAEAGTKRAGSDGIAAKVRGLFARSAASTPEVEASTDGPSEFAIDEASAARPRRSASRYVMTAVLVLALGGGAAAAFTWMRPSGDTQAHAPAAAFGALAKLSPEASQAKQPTTTAKSEGRGSPAAHKSASDGASSGEAVVAVQADAVPSNAGAPTSPTAMPATAEAVQPGAAASNEAVAVQPGAAGSTVGTTAPVTDAAFAKAVASNATAPSNTAVPSAVPTAQPSVESSGTASASSKAALAVGVTPEPEPQVAPTRAEDAQPAAAVAAVAEDELQDADDDDSQPDAPAPNPAVKRAERLVDEGLSLAKQGRFGLAEAAHLRALRVFPNYPRALAGLVRVHLARKDGAEAVRWAKRLAARQPSRAQNHLLLGDAQALRGDAKAARRAWSKAARNGSATARGRLKSANAKG